ncbi:hypothetical protein LSH36_540g01076 [Paralvinella palmiformis]|uniref:BET1 homolog n=1 Tax=Paralvinella palmiformis TaxID=53620 RepID=A0AAD9J8K8_9ANNE|nr:hypothetical protein LSH36_540g01076 [Paralvinella palmiformis]
MRRQHLADNYGYQGNQLVEEENDEMTQGLSDKVKTLKSLTIDIGTEVKEHNRFLAQMETDFENTGGFLGSTMKRVQAMARAGHNCYIWYLLLFSLFVFFVIWLLVKFS